MSGGATADDPVFALRQVQLRRERRQILSDVSWTVRDGERWVVLGPNGAGKTSLVRILSTYLTASSGSVDVLGRRVGRADVRELRRRIGYLSPSLAPMIPDTLGPRQIVTAAQAGATVPWFVDPGTVDPQRSEDALARVGMAGAPERPFATFSSGEQLRILIARAVVTAPRALLLDEPMGSLDIGGREILVATLGALAAGDIGAMVIVVHRVEDIPPGFTHALLMRDGRIVASGRLEEVMTDAIVTACFATPLSVRREGERWFLRAGAPQPSAELSSSQSIASR